MKVVVLTTSYPAPEHPVAGTFVAAAVDGVRALGIDIEVVSPTSFRDFGLAYGSGIAQNLRAAPWKLVFAPAFLAEFARAARRAARDADLVHAHWIPSALAARATGKPYVLQVWGTDIEFARRVPHLARPLVRGARVVIAASTFLADQAQRLGAREVVVIPPGVAIPVDVGAAAEPPHVLFAGRLSREKGVLEFVEATEGLPRVIIGDGPLRPRVPDTLGFVSPSEMSAHYARASVVCVPSRREGYGMTAREAMAHGRGVVASRVGGLVDLEGPGAVIIPPLDVPALRGVVIALLENGEWRQRLGDEARTRALLFSRDVEASRLREVYLR